MYKRQIQLSDNADTINRALTMLPERVDKVAALIKKDEKKEEPADVYKRQKVDEVLFLHLGAAAHRNVAVQYGLAVNACLLYTSRCV